MQTSKPYKIFGHGRGIDISQQTPQGRNVQPFTGSKKLQQPYQKQIQSPFDGYTLPTNSSQNFLATSQVSDLNLQLTRKLIKQQLSKISNLDQSKTKNDIDVMKTQIRTIKQLVSQNLANNNNQQLKKDILKQFDRLLQQYHDQTARNLREVIKKFDQSIKLDCTNKFLPIAFINDLQKQLLELEDRIILTENKLNGNKQKRPSQDPVVIAEAFQLRLKKNQRQYELLKKSISQIQIQINNINQTNTSFRNKQNQEDQRIVQKIQQIKKNFAQNQKQVKNLNLGLEQVKRQQQLFSKNIKQLQDFRDQSPLKFTQKIHSNQSSEVKEFLHGSKGLAVSSVFESSSKQDHSYKKLFKSPQKDSLSHKDSSNSLQDTTTMPSYTKREPNQICYRIDKQNYLLDEDGNYILNDNGKQVQLTQQQIAILRKSTLVKLCE